MNLTTGDALTSGLQRADTENTRAVLQDIDAYNFMLSMFNNTVGMASGSKVDIAVGLANKALSTTDLVAKSSNANGVAIGSAATQIILSSLSLLSLGAKATPGQVLATAGTMLATKKSIALGMVGNDDKKAKCLAAFADIAAGAGTVAMAALAAAPTGGLTAFMIAGGISQVILGGYKVSQSCNLKN